MQLTIKKPSRFVALSNVKIRQGGKPFYSCLEDQEFNLPIGTFEISGIIDEIPFRFKRINYEHIVTPLKPIKSFNIEFKDNYPHVCSVFLDTGKVIADTSFKKAPAFVFVFTLLHEQGHFFYRGKGQISEMQCDTYARSKMLEMGYNPSQIDLCARYILSDIPTSKQRKKLSFNQLKK